MIATARTPCISVARVAAPCARRSLRRRLLRQRRAAVGGPQPARHRRAQGHRPHARAAARVACRWCSPTASRWNAASCPTDHHRARRDARRSAGAAARSSSASRCRPDAAYPAQTLSEELFVIVQDGSATIEFDGKTAELTKDHVLYLQPGAVRSMKAGANGLEGVRGLLAGAARSPRAGRTEHVRRRTSTFPDQGVTPSLQPGVVVNLNEIQWTPLTDPVAGKSYRRSTALLAADLGEERADQPGPHGSAVGDRAAHPSRRSADAHGPRHARAGRDGSHRIPSPARRATCCSCRAAWCTRQSSATSAPISSMSSGRCGPITSSARRSSRRSTSRSSRPDAKPKKLAEGFTFTEGPTWLKGKLYFSDMYFKNPAAGDWTGSPARSRLIVMEPDGKWRVLSSGMQSNGTIAAQNGNLHRLRHVRSPRRGSGSGDRPRRARRARQGQRQADRRPERSRDGREGRPLHHRSAVHARGARRASRASRCTTSRPTARRSVVIGPGEYAMPNGVELSPDGKTLYVNNTWLQPGENFVWAYDVAADGSLSNKRQFAMLNLTPEVLEAQPIRPTASIRAPTARRSTPTAATTWPPERGVQIFLPDGTYAGTIWVPQYPVSITFGGAEQRRALHGGRIVGVVDPDEGPRLPSSRAA